MGAIYQSGGNSLYDNNGQTFYANGPNAGQVYSPTTTTTAPAPTTTAPASAPTSTQTVLSPSQIDSYYATQGNAANPLSPTQYLASISQPPPAPPPPPTTTSISSSTLAPPTATNFNQPTQTPTYPVGTLSAPDFSLSAAQQPASDLTKAIEGLNTQEAGKADYQTQENTAFGVDTAQKSIQDLSTQLTGIKNEAAAIPLQLQQGAADRGVTTPVLGAQENSRLRTNAIAALGVSTLLNAAQGNLATAQAMADKAVAQKYGPIEAQIEASMKNLQLILNSPEYTNAEKQQAFQQQQYLQQQSTAVAQQKQDYTNVLSIATNAAKNIDNFKATAQYPTASAALQAMSQAQTPDQALQIAAISGLSDNKSASGMKIIGSATAGYYQVNPDGTTTPIKLGSNGQPVTGTYQAGMLTTLLQSKGQPTDDASLAKLWTSLGFSGTYSNDVAHNSQIYSKLGGTYPTASKTTTSTYGGKQYTQATQFISDNPSAGYDQLLNSILQYTNLTETEANALLASKGIKKPSTSSTTVNPFQ